MSKSTRIFEFVHMPSGWRSHTVREIAQALQVSERTAFRYLDGLLEKHIHIYRDDHGYRLLDTATLKPLNVTIEEHALLKVVLNKPALHYHPPLNQRQTALEYELEASISMAEEPPQSPQWSIGSRPSQGLLMRLVNEIPIDSGVTGVVAEFIDVAEGNSEG